MFAGIAHLKVHDEKFMPQTEWEKKEEILTSTEIRPLRLLYIYCLFFISLGFALENDLKFAESKQYAEKETTTKNCRTNDIWHGCECVARHALKNIGSLVLLRLKVSRKGMRSPLTVPQYD